MDTKQLSQLIYIYINRILIFILEISHNVFISFAFHTYIILISIFFANLISSFGATNFGVSPPVYDGVFLFLYTIIFELLSSFLNFWCFSFHNGLKASLMFSSFSIEFLIIPCISCKSVALQNFVKQTTNCSILNKVNQVINCLLFL